MFPCPPSHSLSLSLSLSFSLRLPLFLFSVELFSPIALSLLSSHRIEHPLNPLALSLSRHFPRFLSTVCLRLPRSILFSFSVSIPRAFLGRTVQTVCAVQTMHFLHGLAPLSWEVKISAARRRFSIRIFNLHHSGHCNDS